MFDIRGFVEVSSTQLLFIIGIVMAIVTAVGKFGITGKVQLIVAIIVGLLIGAFYFLASWGIPGTIAMWFALLIIMLIVALVPIGAYELVFKPVKDIAKK